MFKKFTASHVVLTALAITGLTVLVIAGLAFGGVMLYQSGFAQGAVTQLPEGALEGLSALPHESFRAQRFANPAFGASPLLMGFSLFFRIIFFMVIISMVAGLFRRVLWGGRWGHYPHHAYARPGYRHPGGRGYGWYYGPVPPMEEQQQGNEEDPEKSGASDPQ
jgi:hypothetical protein